MALAVPVFAASFESKPLEERASYVAQEVMRLIEEGGQLLLPILQPRVATEAQVMALEMLRANKDNFSFGNGGVGAGPTGGTLYSGPSTFQLRLVKGAVPPPVDPQGRPLSPGDVGRVLVAKTGVLEGPVVAQRGDASREFTGEARNIRALTGQDVLRMETFTAEEPTEVSLNDAVAVLRRWGWGCQLKRFLLPRSYRKPAGEVTPEDNIRQDQWLLEELPVARKTMRSVAAARAARNANANANARSARAPKE